MNEEERTYMVTHIKKDKEIIKTSKGTYDACKKYAKMKGLRSTVGVNAYLIAVGDSGLNKEINKRIDEIGG